MTPHLEELASLYVLDRLDGPERADFEAQLARDPELQQLVRELETAAEHRVRSLPQYNPPRKLFSQIESELFAAALAPAAEAKTRVTPIWSAFARWSLAAAAAIALGAATFFFLDRQRSAPTPIVLVVGLNGQSSTSTALPFPNTSSEEDRFVQLASLAETYWAQPPQRSSDATTPPGDGAAAYALFDPASRQGFIGVQQLPATSAGKRYRLWVIDAATGKAWDAGVLPLDASPRGLYSFCVDLTTTPSPAKLDFLITAEDAAAPPPSHPRGEPVLGENPI